jgi:hypothetical protein
MGITHKLNQEIVDFVLSEKKKQPALSCRILSRLTKNKFQYIISKSSINAIFKDAGLSMPVGRRQKRHKQRIIMPALPDLNLPEKPVLPTEAAGAEPPAQPVLAAPAPAGTACPVQASGIVLLQAADYLLGGSRAITGLVRRHLGSASQWSQAMSENLLYQPLLNPSSPSPYLDVIQGVSAIEAQLAQLLSAALPEVRCLRLCFVEEQALYLDGQAYTFWNAPQVPSVYSTTIYNTKSYVKRHLQEGAPFVFFMLPPYPAVARDFLSFSLKLVQAGVGLEQVTLYDQVLKEGESLNLGLTLKNECFFGLWPWQFSRFRKVSRIGEFQPLALPGQQQDLYVAEIRIIITQPLVPEEVTLGGIALKNAAQGKAQLVVLTNHSAPPQTSQEIASIYLGRWPGPAETFEDFSRKLEYFTYTAGQHKVMSIEPLKLPALATLNTRQLCAAYLRILDLFVRWHFLPAGYENTDFPLTQELFYSLAAEVIKKGQFTCLKFKPGPSWDKAGDLAYCLNRVNERGVILEDGTLLRLWL